MPVIRIWYRFYGRNIYKNGLTSLGQLYSKYNPKSVRGKVENVNNTVDEIQSKLSKYL